MRLVNKPLTRSGDHLSYRITQCHLPLNRGDSPDFTSGIHQYSFYRLMEGGRLSQSRHCRKGTAAVPKTVYHSSCHDKRTDGGFSPAARYACTRPLRPARPVGVSNGHCYYPAVLAACVSNSRPLSRKSNALATKPLSHLVSGLMFLLLLAHPGSPGPRALKR